MVKWWGVVFCVSLLVGCHSAPKQDASVAVRLYLGQQYLRLHQLTNAERNFRKVTEMQPKNSQAWWGLAQTAAQQGNTTAALDYYQQAYQMAPENTELSDNYGAFLCTLGQYDEAQRIVKGDRKTKANERVKPLSRSVCLNRP